MGYSSGLLKDYVTILNRTTPVDSKWGRDGSGIEWKEELTVHASVDWAKGKGAMIAGSVDVYGVVIVRMRWNNIINMRSRVKHDGQMYHIIGETFHADKQDNSIQFHAQVIINNK